jgi:arylformamidase
MTTSLTGASLPDDVREREYSPSSCIGGNYRPFIEAYAAQSTLVYQQCAHKKNLAYGSLPSNTLDLFLPRDNGVNGNRVPLLVFIHGGYWQELSKEASVFAAADCIAQGFAFCAIDYTLAPHVGIQTMIQECKAALAWLHNNADQYGFDANQIVVAGSSAGAHLASLCAECPGVKGVVLVSGIYELEPLIGTTVNPALQLTLETAHAASPQRMSFTDYPSAVICWGEIETAEFKRQSREFAGKVAKQARADATLEVFEIAQRNHFDVIMDLARPQTPLGESVKRLLIA